MSKAELVLKIEKVNKYFNSRSGKAWVLKNLDLEIEQGEFVVLFGPSGCGKSTLLHICMGLEPMTSGNVQFLGQNIALMSDDELAEFRKNNVGIVYQQSNWLQSADVLTNVAFPLMLKGFRRDESMQKARESLELVGMTDWLSYFPSELSSGQQQKVGLARCLVSEPSVIIADEPTGNMDYKSSLDLIELFQKLSQEGTTILMVTHNLANLNYADKIVQMFDGQIIKTINPSSFSDKEVQETLTSKVDTRNTVKEIAVNSVLNTVIQPRNNRRSSLKGVLVYLVSAIKILLLILSYFVDSILFRAFKSKLMPSTLLEGYSSFSRGIYSSIEKIDKQEKNSIRFSDIAKLSLGNLITKKSRSLVTIGGVAVGIAFTVLLISIGYGLENLVVSQVASLEELNQVDVAPTVSSNIFLTDTTIENISNLEGVADVLPIVSVAGIVKIDGFQTETVVYGVGTNHLSSIGNEPDTGVFFLDDEEQILFADNQVDPESEVDPLNPQTRIVDLGFESRSQAVINTPILELIGLSAQEAVGKAIDIEFIVTSNLIDNSTQIKSTGKKYEIIGVINEGENPAMYIPINDLEPLGINKYSQFKVLLNDEDSSVRVRMNIEALGFKTTSILDTVVQIESFFTSLRIVFAFLGAIALFVGSLGMFNTLTVSLLERTREVGLMKAIGMKSGEVRELFLAESILMGIGGGVVGVLGGIIIGIIISSIISIISITRGGSYLSVTYVPVGTVISIILLSCLIGIITGIYPARRATRISALNALRYE